MRHAEVRKRLLADPWVREAYENPPLPLATARAVVERRKELGMTQEELAERMGTSQAQVWRIESGSFNPTAKTLSRLENALDISFSAQYRNYEVLSPQEAGTLTPLREQLEEWIEEGILVMSEADLEAALEMEKAKPGTLSKLLRVIENIELDGGEHIQVKVRLAKDTEENDPAQESSRRMELSATF